MKKISNIITITEDITVGDNVLEKGDKIKIVESQYTGYLQGVEVSVINIDPTLGRPMADEIIGAVKNIVERYEMFELDELTVVLK